MPNWKADDWSAAERGRLSLGMMYGLVAARSELAQTLFSLKTKLSRVSFREALADAGWDKRARESREERTGVSGGA